MPLFADRRRGLRRFLLVSRMTVPSPLNATFKPSKQKLFKQATGSGFGLVFVSGFCQDSFCLVHGRSRQRAKISQLLALQELQFRRILGFHSVSVGPHASATVHSWETRGGVHHQDRCSITADDTNAILTRSANSYRNPSIWTF